MNLRFYRQGKVVLKDGITIYTGEDARPYVDEKLLIVADGLGGTGALRHSTIDKAMFDRETVSQALFKDIYDDLGDGKFTDYVKNSFEELYLLKKNYTDNIYAIKKSSYFGSRILASIFLYHMTYDEELAKNKIFDSLFACEETEREEFLDSLGHKIKTIIKTDMEKVAKNVNLVCETSMATRNFKLLATTLCACLFRENEHSVQAIYFMVGDSRPYVWSEADGLCQIIDDKDEKDGAMSGCISLSDDFSVVCKCYTFKKPCVLFNASDGCFDSGRFFSPMAFEKLLLDEIVASESIEDAENKLVIAFDTYGTHDDSSSLAMRCFGYESYQSFKEACQERLDTINNEYLNQMEGLLDFDYISEYERAEEAYPVQLSSLKKRFESEQAIIDFCSEALKTGKFKPYAEKKQNIAKKIAIEKNRLKLAEQTISRIIIENYKKFKGAIGESGLKKRAISKNDKIHKDIMRAEDSYVVRLQEYKRNFDQIVAIITKLLDDMCQIGIPNSFDDYKGISFLQLDDCQDSMDELFEFFEGVCLKDDELLRTLISKKKEYIEQNKKAAEQNPKIVGQIRKMVYEGKILISDVDISSHEKTEITKMLEIIKKTKETIKRLEKENDESFNEAGVCFWESQYLTIIMTVINDSKYQINEDLANEARTIIDDYKELKGDTKKKYELQRKLFEKYEEKYKQYM